MRSLSLCEFLDEGLKMQRDTLIPTHSQLTRNIFSTQIWKSLKPRMWNHLGGASTQVAVILLYTSQRHWLYSPESSDIWKPLWKFSNVTILMPWGRVRTSGDCNVQRNWITFLGYFCQWHSWGCKVWMSNRYIKSSWKKPSSPGPQLLRKREERGCGASSLGLLFTLRGQGPGSR